MRQMTTLMKMIVYIIFVNKIILIQENTHDSNNSPYDGDTEEDETDVYEREKFFEEFNYNFDKKK